jgi:glycosyltransferase involved in cell wall biosynthesis
MNILYIHNAPLDSEQANLIQVLSMCEALSELGNKVTLILEKSKNEFDTTRYLMDKFGIEKLFELYFYEGNFSVFGRLKQISILFSDFKDVLKSLIRNNKFDLIYIRHPLFLYWIVNQKIPFVFELHNNNLHYESIILNFIYKHYLLKNIKNRYFVKVIVISEALKKYWANEGIPEEKIFVYHDGYNPKLFNNLLTKNEARYKLNLPLDKKIITYSGSLYMDRGIELVLETAKELPEHLFLLVGGPSDRVLYYKDQIQKLKINNIMILGRVEPKKVPLYLSASDILLLLFTDKVPTINFCSPLKVFEYMASGRTIIAHKFPTIEEILVDGVSAHFVEPNNSKAIVLKIKQIINENNDLIAKTAQKIAANNFSWEIRARKVIEACL